nr:SDR family oxidoreductase [Pigmentibacter ruber]
MKRIALVTGGNRGIGFEVCRQLAKKGFHVVLSSRNDKKGKDAVKKLNEENLSISYLKIDVTKESSIKTAAKQFAKEYGVLDVLINNAGGNYDYGITPTQSQVDFIKETLELNLLSAWTTTKHFLPLLLKSSFGKIVNVSSGAGSHGDLYFGLATNNGSVASYGISKLALNGLTVKLAAELKDKGILVNSVCPGFTATTPEAKKMGARPVEEGAASVVWGALLEKHGPTGGFFRDGKSIGW